VIEIAKLDVGSALSTGGGLQGELLMTAKVQPWTRSGRLPHMWVTITVAQNASDDSKMRLVLEAAAERLQQRLGIDLASLEQALDDALARYGRMRDSTYKAT
jgi:hypothetical protein